jgi:hypothetical protein
MLMVASKVEKDWQAGRNRFNHDWLKNKFSLALERAVKIAQERIEDDAFAARFIENALPEFDAEMQNARELIGSFEGSMSPRVLLDREPLCRLDDRHRDWLGQVVHACWKHRIGASELVDTAIARLEEALSAFVRLRQCIEGKCGKLEGQQLACCRAELLVLRDACGELGIAISRFPNRIMVG